MSTTMVSLSPPAFLPPSLPPHPAQSMSYFLCCLWNGTHSLFLFCLFLSLRMNEFKGALTLDSDFGVMKISPPSPLLPVPPPSQQLPLNPLSPLSVIDCASRLCLLAQGGACVRCVSACMRGCGSHVCVVQPSFALPPVWLQGEFVCVLFVLSTLVRGVPLSL